MGDIFAEWKKQRFVLADKAMFPELTPKHLVILTDVSYFTDHIEEFQAWCEQHKCNTVGMTVEIPTDELLTLFTLRWS